MFEHHCAHVLIEVLEYSSTVFRSSALVKSKGVGLSRGGGGGG